MCLKHCAKAHILLLEMNNFRKKFPLKCTYRIHCGLKDLILLFIISKNQIVGLTTAQKAGIIGL